LTLVPQSGGFSYLQHCSRGLGLFLGKANPVVNRRGILGFP